MVSTKSGLFRAAEKVFGTRAQEWRWRRGNFDAWVSDGSLCDDPHRAVLLDLVEAQRPFGTLLEVGCNWGPNLVLLRKRMPDVALHGVDINARSVAMAQQRVDGDVRVGSALDLPYADGSMDIVMTDAALTYIGGDKIEATLSELLRVARGALILCEFHADGDVSSNPGTNWLHPYAHLLAGRADVRTFPFPPGALDATSAWDCGPAWRTHAAITVATVR